MNVAAPILPLTTAGVAVVTNRDALTIFRQADCAAAIYARTIPSDVAEWLDAVPAETLPTGRVVLQASSAKPVVEQLCEIAGLSAGPSRDWLIADIADLANTFAKLMSCRFIRLRLDAITTNACRRFHKDAITGRLVCTYRGTGTQYGTAQSGNDPSQIMTVPRGAPILLRGSLWQPQPDAQLLHRSPPIEGSGETRLVLVLDPAEDPDDQG